MDIIIFIIVLITIISKVSKNKREKQAQEARRAAQAQQAQTPPGPRFPLAGEEEGFPEYAPAQQAPRQADPRFPEYAPAQQAPRQADPRFPEYAPVPPPVRPAPPVASARPVQAQPAQRQELGEGMGTQRQRAGVSVRSAETTLKSVQGRRHTLEASSITGHAHVESGMEHRLEPCPPSFAARTAAASPRAAAVPAAIAALAADKDALKQAVLYTEILGKPKALRRC